MQVEDVGPGRVGVAAGGEGRLGHRHATAAGDQQVHDALRGRRRALTRARRDHVRAGERRVVVVLRAPARDVPVGDVAQRLARPATAVALGLVEDDLVAVILDVLQRRLDRQLVHVGVGVRPADARRAGGPRLQRRLDRVRDAALQHRERRHVDRREVVPHARRVVAERDPRTRDLRVAQARQARLDVERVRQPVLDVEVVLVVDVVRRRARMQQRRVDVAVQVERDDRPVLHDQVADQPGLRLGGDRQVAVEVVARRVGARVGDASVRVRRDVEDQDVALQQRLDSGVGARRPLIEDLDDRVRAFLLVAVDVAVDEQRRLVVREQVGVGAGAHRIVLDELPPRALLRGLGRGLRRRQDHGVEVPATRRLAGHTGRDTRARGLQRVQLGGDLVVGDVADPGRAVGRVVRPDRQYVLLRIRGPVGYTGGRERGERAERAGRLREGPRGGGDGHGQDRHGSRGRGDPDES